MKSVELFAGAGGLALGIEQAGFDTETVVEWDKWACDTIRNNQNLHHPLVSKWNIVESDVRDVNWETSLDHDTTVDLVAGGPPCQPFSNGGKHLASDDTRDMFPVAAETVRRLTPKVFIFENVRGLTRPRFQNYFNYILLRLRFPENQANPGEAWQLHLQRLQKLDTNIPTNELVYDVQYFHANAADYGIPQQRHRIFIVGFRQNQNIIWKPPPPTHSRDALLYDQWVTGDYWERLNIPKGERAGTVPPSPNVLKKLRNMNRDDLGLPWKTVREAIGDLPEPSETPHPTILNHVLKRGAKTYLGHTGSPLDFPAKTLKAGVHGVPGGENMLLKPDGTVRYFTVRESARLQTFPDDYELSGAWSEAMRQLGNAVPVQLAAIVAESVKKALTR